MLRKTVLTTTPTRLAECRKENPSQSIVLEMKLALPACDLLHLHQCENELIDYLCEAMPTMGAGAENKVLEQRHQ